MVIVKDQFSHLVNLNINAQHNKRVKMWAQFWSSKLRDDNGEKNTVVTRSCVLSDAWFLDLKILLWALEIKFKYFSWKFLLSRKLRHFRESRFSQCFVWLKHLHLTKSFVKRVPSTSGFGVLPRFLWRQFNNLYFELSSFLQVSLPFLIYVFLFRKLCKYII